MLSPITSRLLDWYALHARHLPWRGRTDAYTVWVSEIMLQQTRVETVLPFFERWMERFPNVAAVAAASQQDVLTAWEGLGYYGRVRNLHRAAQIVMVEYDGELPCSVEELRGLPGVGRYTAGAIASIACGLDEPALDGNIQRVLARLFDVTEPARSPAGERRLLELATAHLPSGRAGEYNQALMDLGAMVCTPHKPACSLCPVLEFCRAHLLGIQEERPVKKPRPAIPHYLVTAAIIERDGQVLLAQRPAEGLLGGLWEFPGGKVQEGENLPTCLKREIHEELGVKIRVGKASGVYRHAYTHFRVTLHAFRCVLVSGEPRPIQVSDLRWATLGELAAYPMGKIDRMIASQITHEAVSQP